MGDSLAQDSPNKPTTCLGHSLDSLNGVLQLIATACTKLLLLFSIGA